MSAHQARESATPPSPLVRGSASDGALHDVCAAAADYDRASGMSLLPPSPAVVAMLAGAVRAYAAQCRDEHLPPERVLVRLKQAVADCAPHVGRVRPGQGCRDVVFAAFLDAYFPGDALRSAPRHTT